MRISTLMFHRQSIDGLMRNQAALLRTQNQIAANTRLLTAADDPAAAAQALQIDQQQSQLQSWSRNIDTASARLGLEENALNGVTDVLNRVRELALQGNSATLSDSDRKDITQEMTQLQQQLAALANSSDGEGGYLFGGSAGGAQPFSIGGSGASYAGDQSTRSLRIGAGREIADGDDGVAVFMHLSSGNGRYAVAADAANTGAAALNRAAVTDASLWDGGSYAVSFSGGNYEVRDGAGNIIAGGAWAEGDKIRFRGIELGFSGTPADGDRFAVAPSQAQDVFATVGKLAQLVQGAGASPAARAQDQTAYFQALDELDAAMNHVSAVRSSVGNRLGALDDAQAQIDAQSLIGETRLEDLRGLDYVEASTRLAQQTTALQAAQQSYALIQRLSLFDYLR